MYVIKKNRNDGTVQYVASFKISSNGADIKYHSNPRYSMVFSDMPSAKALVQLAGVAFAATIEIVDFESCLAATNTNVTFAGLYYDDMTPGKLVTWGDINWKVVKCVPEDTKVYLMTQTHIGYAPYAKPTYNAKRHYVDHTGDNFKRSNLFTLCKYMSKSLEGEPDFDKLVETSYGLKVGVMTKEMILSIDKKYTKLSVAYWTSSAHASNCVLFVDSDGGLYGSSPSFSNGFRPYICVNMADK